MELSIEQKTTEQAEIQKVVYQDIINNSGFSVELTAVTANLNRSAAFIIPVFYLELFNKAIPTDKVRFVLVAQRTLQLTGTGSAYLEVFDIEYNKEFI